MSLPVRALRVEDAQRVRLRARELVAEQLGVVAPVRQQHLSVPVARRSRVTHRVDRQPVLLQPDVLVEAVRERDDLDVDRRVLDAEHLHADLPVLAIAARLRSFVAEVRGDVPDLPRQHRPVLHERPHHRRGSVGPQRERAAALVGEVVELLAYDVARRPSFCTTSRCSKTGRDEQAEAGSVRAPREARDERLPPV